MTPQVLTTCKRCGCSHLVVDGVVEIRPRNWPWKCDHCARWDGVTLSEADDLQEA